MNQSLTTSSLSRLKRRSTRFDGANDRTLHISYSRRTVRLCSIIPCMYVLIFVRFTWGLVDKTIKLWKVFEKSLRVVSESNMSDGQQVLPPPAIRQHLRLPRMQHQDNIIAAVPRKVYSNAHAYHIHSITVNSDQETYISADDLRVNLWNLNISDQSFSQLFSWNVCSSLS
jgi:hypothetical protein